MKWLIIQTPIRKTFMIILTLFQTKYWMTWLNMLPCPYILWLLQSPSSLEWVVYGISKDKGSIKYCFISYNNVTTHHAWDMTGLTITRPMTSFLSVWQDSNSRGMSWDIFVCTWYTHALRRIKPHSHTKNCCANIINFHVQRSVTLWLEMPHCRKKKIWWLIRLSVKTFQL